MRPLKTQQRLNKYKKNVEDKIDFRYRKEKNPSMTNGNQA